MDCDLRLHSLFSYARTDQKLFRPGCKKDSNKSKSKSKTIQKLCKNHIGALCMTTFSPHSPNGKILRDQNIESSRYNGATTENIKHAFATKIEDPPIKAVKLGNRYNIDEPGIIEGLGCRVNVVESAKKKVAMLKNPGSHFWRTMLKYVSAIGGLLCLLVIF